MFLNFIIEEVLFCFGFDGNKVIIFLFVGFLVVGLCCGWFCIRDKVIRILEVRIGFYCYKWKIFEKINIELEWMGCLYYI